MSDTAIRPLCMGMRGEGTGVWFDVYARRRPVPSEFMLGVEFMRCLVDSGGTVGAWHLRGDWGGRTYVTLTVGGREYVYRQADWGTAGGFTLYRWPD